MVVKKELRYGNKRNHDNMMNTQQHTDSYAGFAGPHDQALISETEYYALRSGLIPSYARKWIASNFGGVPKRLRKELMEIACEVEYDPATAISIVFAAISNQKSLEKWKKANLSKSYQSISPGQKVNGKWVDLETTLWPPYETPTSQSGRVNGVVYHRSARYVFKHGDIRVDLGVEQDGYKPIMHNNPTAAMQSIATRLGRRINGDYNKVAQILVGNEDLIVTSTSARIGNQWIVLLTMMRNPKITPSAYHVAEQGTVVSADGHHPANSISETEYALIKGIIEENDDEHALDYCYEFDQDKQVEILMEGKTDQLDADSMSPSMLTVMGIAAVNDDLIDFMNESATYVGNDYDQIVDTMVEDEADRLYAAYNVNRLTYAINNERKRAIKNSKHADPKGKEYIINQSENRISELIKASNVFDKKLYYLCLIEAATKHDDIREAIEDCTMVYRKKSVKPQFYTMKGSNLARVRFFGIPSTYPKVRMPARNPFSQTKFLSSVPEGKPIKPKYEFSNYEEDTVAEREGTPSGVTIIKRMKVPYDCEYIDANGNRGRTPAKKPTQFNLQDNPRLATIVSALALTGSLPKALKITRKKLSFA